MGRHRAVQRTSAAEADLVRLWLHIANHKPDAADRHIRRIEKACEGIADFPARGRARPDLGEGVRRLVVGDYVVFYELVNDIVVVLRVFHGREDSEPWEDSQ